MCHSECVCWKISHTLLESLRFSLCKNSGMKLIFFQFNFKILLSFPFSIVTCHFNQNCHPFTFFRSSSFTSLKFLYSNPRCFFLFNNIYYISSSPLRSFPLSRLHHHHLIFFLFFLLPSHILLQQQIYDFYCSSLQLECKKA